MVPVVVSGIAGIVLSPGQTIDPQLLQRMATSMTRRGPDGQQTWISGPVGFAQTWLYTGSPAGQQPATLDGDAWIIADARIDGRAALIRALEASGRKAVAEADDAQLILQAYHAWGDHCVDHLIGDFAFAIWDGHAQRVFCARDRFGIKPFYYAVVEGGFVFSNTLDCVRLHPDVDGTLNELSIADFLLFGVNHDVTATVFAHVHRLPPAHVLTGSAAAPLLRRYWKLPTEGHIRYTRSRDYLDHFAELLRQAVADRIGPGTPAIWMSGGIDSTSIAVTARQVLTARGAASGPAAHTVVFDSLFADDERSYAALAAETIGISPRYWPADGELPFESWHQSGLRMPEPLDDPYHALHLRRLEGVGEHSRIVLAGDGADEVFWPSSVADLAGRMPFWRLASDVGRCALERRRPAFGIRAALTGSRRQASDPLPRWLNPDLVEQWRLEERVQDADAPSMSSALRSEAHRRLSSPAWAAFLESLDPGVTGVPLEHRWPFLDLRLVNYVLAIPSLPWCVDKHLLRTAMRDALPPRLLRRKKSPLAYDPLHAHLQRGDWSWLDRFEAAPQLATFVNRAAIPPAAALATEHNPWRDLRPFCLNYWLSRVDLHAA